MRIYDPRAGRFLSVDPLTGNYPYYTPYQFAGNQPIWATDLDGMEPSYAWQDNSGVWREAPVGDNLARKQLPPGHEQFMKNGITATTKKDQDQQFSDFLDWVPLIGQIKALDQAVKGEEWFTKRKLGRTERLISGAAAIGPKMGGKPPANPNAINEAEEGIAGRMGRGNIRRPGEINTFDGKDNCAGCALAGDAKLKGYQAQALNHGPISTDIVKSYFPKSEWEAFKTAGALSKKVSKLKEGSTGIIFADYGPGIDGHYINVVKQDGVVQFFDFQKKGSALVDKADLAKYKTLWLLNTTEK